LLDTNILIAAHPISAVNSVTGFSFQLIFMPRATSANYENK